MEGELGNSERSLSSLIENVPGIVYRSEYDKDWTMRYLSDICSEITGYDPSELIDNRRLAWAEIIHPEDREKVWREITESLKENGQFKVEYRIITEGGEKKWVWEQGTAVRDEEGNVEALEGFITDITEKIEYQKKLEKREKKVKELYEASTKLASCNTKQEVYELAVESAENILGFYTSGFFMDNDGKLEVKYSNENSYYEKGQRLPQYEGLKGHCFKTKEAQLVRDVSNWEQAKPSQAGLKSGINVPVGEKGVFSAISKKLNYYDEFDLEMAKI